LGKKLSFWEQIDFFCEKITFWGKIDLLGKSGKAFGISEKQDYFEKKSQITDKNTLIGVGFLGKKIVFFF
jgi:hypothetical protein